jgi:hypothetical protein
VAALGLAQRPEKAITPEDLTGTWILQTVAGKPPSSVNIKAWEVSFSAARRWIYGGEMDERFGGMKMSGSGLWKIVDNELDYTAEDNKGKSKMSIMDGVLTLIPDPVVTMPGGKPRAVTTYKKKI